MADRRTLLGPIGRRLAMATVAAAFGAIAVVAALTFVGARHDVSALARHDERHAVEVTTAAVTDSYRAAGSWREARLRAATVLAASNGATLAVLGAAGNVVPVPSVRGPARPRALEGPVYSRRVVVDGTTVGRVVVHFFRASLPTPETHLRNALVRTVAFGAALGALLALGVALVVSRWLTRPVLALTDAVRSIQRGDRRARVGPTPASGELGDLAAAFDEMADTIAREEDLRRAVIADVAHELRTPLAILQASTESLADGIDGPSSAQLSSLHDEVLRLGRSVEDLDTLASVASAELRVELGVVDLSAVASRSIEALRPSYQAAGVHLRARLAAAAAVADPHRAAQVLGNLLTNALKYTPPGGDVTVTVARRADAATLEVSDTGTGIPPDELPHVFERSWRGREAGRVAGSGIGLAVADSLVRALGGTIEVVSEPGAGTRFTVTLARAEVPPPPA